MNKITGIRILVTISLLTSGCMLIPETTIAVEPTLSTPQQVSTLTPTPKSVTGTPTLVTPSPTVGMGLLETDEVVFIIQNPEVFTGREGEARPDWLGWGAQTFTVAPDGTFWIDDTAANPHRLLHYSAQGELLKQISLQDVVVYAYDMLASRDGIWLLDISSQQPKVVQMSLDGELLSSVDIDEQIMMYEGMMIANGVDSLFQGEKGELLLHGVNGYTELIDATGAVVTRPLDFLACYGHRYQTGQYEEATRRIPVLVDGMPFETSPNFYLETPAFLGFNPDGSFALAGYVEEAEYPADFQVKYYHASGELLGTARQLPQAFHKGFNHHLAFGPDGSVYQLVSNPDHSVQVVRLGFAESLPPRPEILQATPTVLAPLMPSESAATEEERARNTLIEFFANLSAGNYAEASPHFGGEVSEYARAQMPDETLEEYWGYLCGFLWCLPVAEITDIEQVSEDEYLFYAVFMLPDGTRFESGACCGGDPAATPPVWQFAYPVEKSNGVWKVMRAPLFTP